MGMEKRRMMNAKFFVALLFPMLACSAIAGQAKAQIPHKKMTSACQNAVLEYLQKEVEGSTNTRVNFTHIKTAAFQTNDTAYVCLVVGDRGVWFVSAPNDVRVDRLAYSVAINSEQGMSPRVSVIRYWP